MLRVLFRTLVGFLPRFGKDMMGIIYQPEEDDNNTPLKYPLSRIEDVNLHSHGWRICVTLTCF